MLYKWVQSPVIYLHNVRTSTANLFSGSRALRHHISSNPHLAKLSNQKSKNPQWKENLWQHPYQNEQHQKFRRSISSCYYPCSLHCFYAFVRRMAFSSRFPLSTLSSLHTFCFTTTYRARSFWTSFSPHFSFWQRWNRTPWPERPLWPFRRKIECLWLVYKSAHKFFFLGSCRSLDSFRAVLRLSCMSISLLRT